MREILFRGKSRYGAWVYGSLIKAGEYCCILEDEDTRDGWDSTYLDHETGCIDGYATPVIPETVGQFTGICDKHGKRIFDGDIVYAKMDYGPAGFMDAVVPIGYKQITGYRWQYFDLNTIAVIGNIYDNIELLHDETDLTDILKGV